MILNVVGQAFIIVECISDELRTLWSVHSHELVWANQLVVRALRLIGYIACCRNRNNGSKDSSFNSVNETHAFKSGSVLWIIG